MKKDLLASLDFSNISDHPSNEHYNVYRFYIREQADYFESLVKAEDVPYERHDDEEEAKHVYYFGIAKRLERRVLTINNLAIGKYREPFIQNQLGAWILVAVVVIILAVAVTGYLLAPPLPQ